MQAEVPCSAGLLAARLVLQADPLKPYYSINKTVQTTRDRKTVRCHEISTCSLCFLWLASLNTPPFIRNLQWRGKTHPSTKRIIIFFETQSKHHRVWLLQWKLGCSGDWGTFLPCWPLLPRPWTGVKDGSSLVAKCEFAKMDFPWPHCFSLLMWKAQEHNRKPVLCCPLLEHREQSDLNTGQDAFLVQGCLFQSLAQLQARSLLLTTLQPFLQPRQASCAGTHIHRPGGTCIWLHDKSNSNQPDECFLGAAVAPVQRKQGTALLWKSRTLVRKQESWWDVSQGRPERRL